MPDTVFEETFVKQFEQQVWEGLAASGIVPDRVPDDLILGAAVSGGADSTAMLTALAHICAQIHIPLHVITINHRIRPDAETGGDVRFVSDYCRRLKDGGFNVSCHISELPVGAVYSQAEKRGRGTEEAARFLRYEAFLKFSEETGVSGICLAHNRNDQQETLLMRFFQGSGGAGSAGIRRRRGIFIRPMLDIPRKNIELYLQCQNISWRTDGTNTDIRYLRNRIRCQLMPFLDTLIPGWQTAVLAGGEKAFEDNLVLDAMARSLCWEKSEHGVRMNFTAFSQQPVAVRCRSLYMAFNLAGCDSRVPYRTVRRICSWSDVSEKTKVVQCVGMCIRLHENVIFVEKQIKDATQYTFFAIIQTVGEYELPWGNLSVVSDNSGIETVSVIFSTCDGVVFDHIPVPFCMRSRQPDDRLLAADGNLKSLNDIFSSWHIEEKNRDAVPVIQELRSPEQRIICVCGSIYGYKDWIVKSD